MQRCREGRAQDDVVGGRKGKERESASQVHLCMFLSLPLCFPSSREGKAERQRGNFAASSVLLPLTREREITVLAGTPRRAVPAQLASPARHPPEGTDAASRPWHHSYDEWLQREPQAFLGAVQPWLSVCWSWLLMGTRHQVTLHSSQHPNRMV